MAPRPKNQSSSAAHPQIVDHLLARKAGGFTEISNPSCYDWYEASSSLTFCQLAMGICDFHRLSFSAALPLVRSWASSSSSNIETSCEHPLHLTDHAIFGGHQNICVWFASPTRGGPAASGLAKFVDDLLHTHLFLINMVCLIGAFTGIGSTLV